MFHLSPLSLLPSLLKLSDFDKVPGVLETGAVCVSTQILSGCHLVHSTLHSRSLSPSLSFLSFPLSFLFLFHQDLWGATYFSFFVVASSNSQRASVVPFLFIATRLDEGARGWERREEGRDCSLQTRACFRTIIFLNENFFRRDPFSPNRIDGRGISISERLR